MRKAKQTSLCPNNKKEDPLKGHGTEYPALNKSIRYLIKERSGSHSSIKKHINDVTQLSKYTGMTPDELIKVEKNKLEVIVKNFLYHYENKKTANSMLQTIKTFFRKNGRDNIEYPQFHIPSRTEIKSLTITMEDAYKMARFSSSPKVRLMIHLLISTGLRVSTMLALRFGIVETENPYLQQNTIINEIEKGEKNPVVIVFPKMKELLNNSCKCEIPYYSFMSEDACEALNDRYIYLKREYGTIEKDDVLFPTYNKNYVQSKYKKIPMTATAVNKMLKVVAKKAGIPHWRKITAKSFRTLYENTIRSQGKEAGFEKEDREFIMGHVLPKPDENYFCPEKVEVLRKKYARICFNPQYKNGVYGDLKNVADFFDLNYDHILEDTEGRHGKNPEKRKIEKTLRELLKNRKTQKIIDKSEVKKYLKNGYWYQAELGGGQIIVEIDVISAKSVDTV